jgi:hypothetical protein
VGTYAVQTESHATIHHALKAGINKPHQRSLQSPNKSNPETLKAIWLSSLGTRYQHARTTTNERIGLGLVYTLACPRKMVKTVFCNLTETGLVSLEVYVAIDPMFEAIKHATTKKVESAEHRWFIGQREAESPDRMKVGFNK